MLDVPRGKVPGLTAVNKFGRNDDIDTASDPEDIWTAGGLWVPPTQARVHNIASTSTADDGDPAGTGAHKVRIWGLQTWDSKETSEDVTLNGTSNVPTTKSYVIIHRMLVLESGSGDTNAGTITATAVTDATVTAQIEAGDGQTLMAVYGVPNGCDFYVEHYYMNWVGGAAASNSASLRLMVLDNPGETTKTELVKHHLGLFGSATTHIMHRFHPMFKVVGPCVLFLRCQVVSANDTDISGGFEGFLEET
jgi:hypothetical protein